MKSDGLPKGSHPIVKEALAMSHEDLAHKYHSLRITLAAKEMHLSEAERYKKFVVALKQLLEDTE